MEKIRVYLSGSIQKGNDDAVRKSVWTNADIAVLHDVLDEFLHLSIMNPASRSDDLSGHETVLGRDLVQVYISDLVLVDGRDRKGIGVGAEMIFAKSHDIPVITISPNNSQYRKKHLEYLGQSITDWIHPFVGGLSDHVAESVHDAALYIRKNYPFDKRLVKTESSLFAMMRCYVETQFEGDIEMFSLVASDQELFDRIERIKNGG